MAAPGTLEFINPTPDQWEAGNPPELKFVFTADDPSLGEVGTLLILDAFIYDTHLGTEPRVERVMEYSQDALGKYQLDMGSMWEGSYEPRLSGEQVVMALFGPPTAVPEEVHGIGTISRKGALVVGTPVEIRFGTMVGMVLTYFYSWWFGVGPAEAWYWPRNRESVSFAGKKMPPPFDQISGIFQVNDRKDDLSVPRYKIPASYAGVDAFSPDGKVVRQTTVTQPVLQAQGRNPPPMFNTGVFVP